MKSEFERDMAWSDVWLPQVADILRSNAMHLVSVTRASDTDDMNHATDMVVQIEGGQVAVRLRRPYYHFRDLTIRSVRKGHETELAKIQRGFARWYLYGWTNDSCINEWMLVDLDKLRVSGLLDGRETRMNKDGETGFIAIPFEELRGCVVSYRLEA